MLPKNGLAQIRSKDLTLHFMGRTFTQLGWRNSLEKKYFWPENEICDLLKVCEFDTITRLGGLHKKAYIKMIKIDSQQKYSGHY